jgi:hypothetical protein
MTPGSTTLRYSSLSIQHKFPKMKSKLYSILSICISLLSFNCEKDETECEGEQTPIPFELLEGKEDKLCVLKNIDDERPQVDLIIQTQDDYEKYIECSGILASINFSDKTLLAGRLKTSYEDKIIMQSYTQDCKRYVFHVEIGLGVAAAPSNVFYFAIVPKITDESKVMFDIQYISH